MRNRDTRTSTLTSEINGPHSTHKAWCDQRNRSYPLKFAGAVGQSADMCQQLMPIAGRSRALPAPVSRARVTGEDLVAATKGEPAWGPWLELGAQPGPEQPWSWGMYMKQGPRGS